MIKNKFSEILGRKRVRMSEIAKLTGLRNATLSVIYNDKCKQIAFETLNKICWALDCKIEDIFEYVPDEE
ncbi:helix-turn-helix domain-containing protein [bacterium]|nr:helix-turn-helix domain-containing protein [bacterium]